MKKESLSYRQQLRDPRWIKLATVLKEDAEWTCEHCPKKQGDVTPQGVVELSIHHTYYVSGMMMWEHPRCLLMCLCNDCHVKRQAIEQSIYINIADVMRDKTNDELLEQPIHAYFTGGFTLSQTESK